MSDDLIIGGHRFGSRFILGSGKFSLDITRAVIENGGVEMATLDVRRANSPGEGNILDQYPDPDAQEKQEAQEEIFRRLLPSAVLLFLVGNIPTVVLGGIWLHYKNRRDFQDDLKKMKIEDLE